MPLRRRWVVETPRTENAPAPAQTAPMVDALHAAQHLADTTGSDVTVRLQPSDPTASPAGPSASEISAGDLVVRPHAPHPDEPRPVPQPPAPSPARLGAWTVTIAVVLDCGAATSEHGPGRPAAGRGRRCRA